MLQRKLGLFQATVLNMIDMVGIGPFVTMPLVIAYVGGLYLYAWLAGALLCLVDAMIWSELGAAYPLAGGSYQFLREGYGKEKTAGKLMSFLYVWQTIIQAPLVAASAAIGFAGYFAYLFQGNLAPWQLKLVSASVIVLITILLYRKIEQIGKIGVWLWIGVIVTMGWIIFGGIQHGNMSMALNSLSHDVSLNTLLSFAFGQACVKTIYSYLGYYNVCHLGGEIIQPSKNIPRSMFISVIGIAILYLLMNLSITGVFPWQDLQQIHQMHETGKQGFIQDPFLIEQVAVNSECVDKFLVSVYIEKLYGPKAAIVATIMILWVALASLFAVLLGYSRVPFAAAVNGDFFRFFGKLHPTKNFPHVSLLTLSAIALVFSLLFKMTEVISGILAMRIIVQFIGQAVGLVLIRSRKEKASMPYRMPMYPIPVILAIVMWLLVFYATGTAVISMFLVVAGSGILFFILRKWIMHKRLTAT
jgi:amino acid transporter